MSDTDLKNSSNRIGAENNLAIENEEYDLIDVIGFFWRSRRLILLGILAGLGLGGATILWNQYIVAASEVSSRDFIIQLKALDPENPMLEISTLQLNAFLNSNEGANSFYTSISSSVNMPDYSIDEWVKKQLNGQGMIGKLENNSGGVSFAFQNELNLSESEIKTALPIALNDVVSRFNKFVGISKTDLVHSKIDLQLKLDILKLRALELFEKHSTLSVGMKELLLAGLMNEITNPSRVEGITFLLSAVPDSIEEKSVILAEYSKLVAAHDILLVREQIHSKKFRLGENSTILSFALSSNLIVREIPDLSLGSKLRKKPFAILSLGALMGAIAGTSWAIFLVFYRNNKIRLDTVLEQAR